jgi:hypothetical protein
MAINQDTKSVSVAGQDLRHYRCICNFHSINLDRNWGEWLGFFTAKVAKDAKRESNFRKPAQAFSPSFATVALFAVKSGI